MRGFFLVWPHGFFSLLAKVREPPSNPTLRPPMLQSQKENQHVLLLFHAFVGIQLNHKRFLCDASRIMLFLTFSKRMTTGRSSFLIRKNAENKMKENLQESRLYCREASSRLGACIPLPACWNKIRRQLTLFSFPEVKASVLKIWSRECAAVVWWVPKSFVSWGELRMKLTVIESPTAAMMSMSAGVNSWTAKEPLSLRGRTSFFQGNHANSQQPWPGRNPILCNVICPCIVIGRNKQFVWTHAGPFTFPMEFLANLPKVGFLSCLFRAKFILFS